MQYSTIFYDGSIQHMICNNLATTAWAITIDYAYGPFMNRRALDPALGHKGFSECGNKFTSKFAKLCLYRHAQGHQKDVSGSYMAETLN